MGRQDTHDSLIGSLELNLAKAIATGWQPQVSLDEGLRLALSAPGRLRAGEAAQDRIRSRSRPRQARAM